MLKAWLGRWSWGVAMAVALATALSCLAMLEFGHQKMSSDYERGLQSLHLANQLNALGAKMSMVTAGAQGYLLTHRDPYLESHQRALAHISQLTADISEYYHRTRNAAALKDFSKVTAEFSHYLGEIEMTMRIASNSSANLTRWIPKSDLGQQAMHRWQTLLAQLHQQAVTHAQDAVAASHRDREMTSISVASIAAIATVLFIFLSRHLGVQLRRQQQEQDRLLDQQQSLDRLVRERTERLEELAGHLQNVIEEEKSRLARELHDELGAILTASKMDVSWVHAKLKGIDPALANKLARTLNHLDQGIQVKRRIIEGMRPTVLDNFGLITALRVLADEAAQQNNWIMQLDFPEQTALKLSESMSIALFRIVQESLNNAAKYARAHHVRVSLAVDEEFVKLEIEDDGVGMTLRQTQQPKRHGMVGMRQRVLARGGKFDIRSAPQHGTEICVLMPIAKHTPTILHPALPEPLVPVPTVTE